MRNQNRRSVLLLCIFTFLFLDAIGCLGQSSPETPPQVAFGHMVLTVRDSATGYAVRASIRVQGQRSLTLETDNAGRITLQLPAGEYAITVSALGYRTMRLAQNLAPIANQNNHVMMDPERTPEQERPDAIRAYIRPGHTLLHGFVGDDDGKPLSAVTVRIGGVQAQTDVRGHYFLSVPTPPMGERGPEPLTLEFQKPGYKTVVIENLTVSSGDTKKDMGLEVGHGEIRSIAPEGPGSGTAPIDSSQKGSIGIRFVIADCTTINNKFLIHNVDFDLALAFAERPEERGELASLVESQIDIW